MLKALHRKRLRAIENFYDQMNVPGITFNEFLVQAHFDWLDDQGKLTAKNMMYKLPVDFHWIAKKFIINKTNRVKVDYKKALINLKLSLFVNKTTDEDFSEYQQLHAPVRSTTIGTCG